MRHASAYLVATLLTPQVQLVEADMYTLVLQDGSTKFFWTTFNKDLPYAGNNFISQNPWLSRSKVNFENTMVVPTMDVTIIALNSGFNGGASIKTQMHNGLFDGAELLLDRAFMRTVNGKTSFVSSPMRYFGGQVSTIDIKGSSAKMKVKGKTNMLDQYAPRNTFQIECGHTFCDAGCTLNRANFTFPFTVGPAPTRTFIPWNGVPPSNVGRFRLGTVRLSNGPASGESRNVRLSDATGLTLKYPLYAVPLVGDSFTAFEGCDKTKDSGSGQDCTVRNNQQHWRAFPFVPSAENSV